VRNAQTAQRHRLNVGAIVSPAVLSVRIAGRRGTAGRTRVLRSRAPARRCRCRRCATGDAPRGCPGARSRAPS
jgi:hypothetical protein